MNGEEQGELVAPLHTLHTCVSKKNISDNCEPLVSRRENLYCVLLLNEHKGWRYVMCAFVYDSALPQKTNQRYVWGVLMGAALSQY